MLSVNSVAALAVAFTALFAAADLVADAGATHRLLNDAAPTDPGVRFAAAPLVSDAAIALPSHRAGLR